MSTPWTTFIRYSFIAAILLSTCKIHGQVQEHDSLAAISQAIDTSDYIPFIFDEALDYNLMQAASKGYSSEIIRLINMGADVDAETNEGATPLVFAVSNNRAEAVSTLISFSPTIDKVTRNTETPLLIAVKNGNQEIAEMLLRAGADVNYADRHGATPLHYAALYGYLSLADMLLYYDASVDAKSNEGTTPLLAAVWAGYTDVADLLTQRGANIEISDNEGYTPFLMASYYGDTLLMDILYKKGANIYAVNKARFNALSLTIMRGEKSATEFLFKIGDKWGSREKDIISPYEVAAKYRRNDIVNLLRENNVPGQLRHYIDQASIAFSERVFLHDIYSGFSFSFKEPSVNGGVIIGLDTKLWYTRVLKKSSENLFYQYMNKESLVYAGLFKDFTLTENPDKINLSLSTALMAGYSFGSSLKGTTISPADKFRVIPSVSLKMSRWNFGLNLGIEYINSEFYHTGPVWLRLGLSYNYFFDKIRTRIKPIRWD
jgi:ankyrin repeat protein